MSDEFAIAAVTATMSYLLDSYGVAVSTRPPDSQSDTGARIRSAV